MEQTGNPVDNSIGWLGVLARSVSQAVGANNLERSICEGSWNQTTHPAYFDGRIGPWSLEREARDKLCDNWRDGTQAPDPRAATGRPRLPISRLFGTSNSRLGPKNIATLGIGGRSIDMTVSQEVY